MKESAEFLLKFISICYTWFKKSILEFFVMTSQIICCGMLVADLKFSTESFPKKDEKVFAESFHLTPGGPATNAAITIQQLGGQAQLLSTCGSCSLSDSILQMVTNTGVNTDKVLHLNDALNVSAVFSEESGERRVISYKQRVDYKSPKYLEKPAVILVDGHQPKASLELLDKFPRVPSILDAGSVHEGTELLYQKVDWLITSKKYALAKTSKETVKEALDTLTKNHSKVVITCGDAGLLYSIGEQSGHIPSIEINCVDSNGAGDVFHGAFAYAISQNKPPSDCLHFANEVAAMSCESPGIIGSF